jgi:hypothetical protein
MLRRILYVLQVLRLIVLMLIGASVGVLMTIGPTHRFSELEERRLSGAIFGALCGFAAELIVRQVLPIPENTPPLRFSLRTLLITITYTAILMGLIAYVLRK